MTAVRRVPDGLRVVVFGQIDAPGSAVRLTTSMRQMLCALVASGRRGLPAEALVDGDPGSATVQSALRMAVSRLRRALGPSTIEAVDGRYRLTFAANEVDLWLVHDLARGASPSDVDDDVLRHLISATPIFPDIAGSHLLDDAMYATEAARRRVVTLVATQRPQLLDASMCADLLEHVDQAPHDESLVRAALASLLSAGDRRAALDLLSRATRALKEAGLDLPADLASTERMLLEGLLPAQTPVRQPPATPTALPPRLREMLSSPFVGDRSVVDSTIERFMACDGRGVSTVVTDLAGAGKSRLIAEIAAGLAGNGWAVVDALASPPPATMALGPFIAALPSLADDVRDVLTSDLDPESRTALLWSATQRALDDRATGRPLLLLVDDAQWLDARSIDLLVQLLTAPTDGAGLAVVVSGRSDPASADAWSAVSVAASRAGAPTVQPPRLDESAMDDFVGWRRPSMPLRERGDILAELTRRSQGMPGVAAVLLAGYDPDTRRLPGSGALGSGSAAALLDDSGLTDAARAVGAIAALAGTAVDVGELVTVSGLSVEDVLNGVDELLRRDLLVELSPVMVTTSHALVDAALLARVSRTQAAQWHASAARLHESDIHRLARHLTGAIPFVSVEDAIDAQVRSAEALLSDGLVREAAEAFDTAALLTGGPLRPELAVGWSRALDVSGAHRPAEEVRARAMETALAAGDHVVAMQLAVSGLPEAEGVDGSATTVANLRLIDPTKLKRRERWEYATTCSRQFGLVGHGAEAERFAESAQRIARTRQEIVTSAVCMRVARGPVTDPWTRLQGLDEVLSMIDDCTPALRADYLLMRALDLYEAREIDEALECHARLRELEDVAPLRRWHALLFQAMSLTDLGHMDEAHETRREALRLATSSAFRQGDSAFLMAEFVDLWRAGNLSAMLPLVDAGALDISRATSLQAAVALVLHDAGRHEQASELAIGAVRKVVELPTNQGISAVAFAAPIVARCDDKELITAAADLLTRRRDSQLVIGAGVANLGSVQDLAAPLVHSVARLSA